MMLKVALSLFVTAVTLIAEPIGIGEKLPTMRFPDQFGKAHTVDAAHCELLLVTSQKDVSIRLKEFIVKQKPNFLQRRHACFLSDIHTMPGFVTRWFALPKMRKYPFKILLIYEKEQNPFPAKEDAVTVITLGKENTVRSIRYVKDPAKIF